jgi:hypothetical protein
MTDDAKKSDTEASRRPPPHMSAPLIAAPAPPGRALQKNR